MHRAYDLALATGYIFAGAYPHFLEVDQIDFKKPVDIGDLVRLKSRGTYREYRAYCTCCTCCTCCMCVSTVRRSSSAANTVGALRMVCGSSGSSKHDYCKYCPFVLSALYMHLVR